MTQKKNVKDIQTKLKAQLAQLEKLSSKSVDPDITAKFIALSDPEVWKLFLSKLGEDDFVFRGIYCIDSPIFEHRGVVFDFECKPDIICLVKPWFLVTVDMIQGKVSSIEDPYMPITSNVRNVLANQPSIASSVISSEASIDPGDISRIKFKSGGGPAFISIDSNNANDIGYTINVKKRRPDGSQIDVIPEISVPSLRSPQHKPKHQLGNDINLLHRTNMIININRNPSDLDEKLSADVVITQDHQTVLEYEARANEGVNIHRRIFRLLVG